MFSADRLRVVAFLAGRPGVGRTTAAANLASALARSGRAVLLADGNPGTPDALGLLGMAARTDAATALDVGGTLESAIVRAPDGLDALRLGAIPRDARSLHLAESLLQQAAAFDYLLLNCPDPAVLATVGADPERLDVVIVLSRAASSITEAYALIKRLNATRSQRRFHVLVSRVDSEAEAVAIYRNMARVADGYLSVTLDFVGYVPADERIARAGRLGRCVLDAWPESAGAAAIRRLAEDISGWPVPRATHLPGAARDADALVPR